MREVAVSDCVILTSDLEIPWRAEPGSVLIEEGLDPAREREIESLLAIGNGYLGVRASIGVGRFSHPATFIAGIYVGNGDLGPRLAVLPHWLNVDVTIEGQRLSIEMGRVLTYRRRLDLPQGILWQEWRQRDPSGRITRLNYFQLASLADRHLLLQSVTVTAENYTGTISLTARLGPSDGSTDLEQAAAEPGAMLLRTVGKEVGVAAALEMQIPASASAGREIGRASCRERVLLGV